MVLWRAPAGIVRTLFINNLIMYIQVNARAGCAAGTVGEQHDRVLFVLIKIDAVLELIMLFALII